MYVSAWERARVRKTAYSRNVTCATDAVYSAYESDLVHWPTVQVSGYGEYGNARVFGGFLLGYICFDISLIRVWRWISARKSDRTSTDNGHFRDFLSKRGWVGTSMLASIWKSWEAGRKDRQGNLVTLPPVECDGLYRFLQVTRSTARPCSIPLLLVINAGSMKRGQSCE